MATITIRPNRPSRWNSGGANRVEPAEGIKTLGNIFDSVANSSNYNWLFNKYYQWQLYYDNFPNGVIPEGVFSVPTVTDAAGPVFSIGVFTLITSDGKRLDVTADTFTPVAPSPELVNPYRLDGIYVRYAEPPLADPTVEYIYVEEISTYDPPAGDYALKWVVIENNVAYTINRYIELPQIDLVNNTITVCDGVIDALGSKNVTVLGIQSAIDVLAANGGGNVNVVGDDFGKEFYSTDFTLTMKSGVTVDFNGSHLYPALTGETPAGLHELVKFEGGFANADILPLPSPGNMFDRNFAGWDWRDYGQLSLIEITTGVVGERGFYLIDEIIDEEIVRLVDMNRDAVVLTAENKTFIVYIYNASLKNIQIDTTRSGADFSAADESAILFDRTYDCTCEDVFIRHVGASLWAGILLWRSNYNPKIIRPVIRGYITAGIYIYNNAAAAENLSLYGHFIDRDALAGGRDINISGVGTGLGGKIGVGHTTGVSTILSEFGWKAYPETEEHETDGSHKLDVLNFDVEHNTDGTHKPDIIDTLELVNEAVIPSKLGDQSLWLLASVPSNDGATGIGLLAERPIGRNIQKAKDGTDESVIYLGVALFALLAATHTKWEIRTAGGGTYHIRPPCVITVGPVLVTPKYVPEDVTPSVIPIDDKLIYTMTYQDADNEKYWTMSFEDAAGIAAITSFQVTFNSSK